MRRNAVLFVVMCCITGTLAISCTKEGSKPVVGTPTTQEQLKNLNLVSTKPSFNVNNDVPLSEEEFTFPGLVGDNMVLQRDAVIKIWGGCAQNGPIAVTIGDNTYFGECREGHWEMYIGPMKAGGPYEVIVRNEKAKAVMHSVLVGDVYICSGQSNMEMTMIATEDHKSIENSQNSKIRLLKIMTRYSDTPVEQSSYKWKKCNPQVVADFSAVAYYFGRTLEEKYDIPIGIIMSAVGDTVLACWAPSLEADKMPMVYRTPAESIRRRPTVFYNGMIYPLRNYGVKGVLWYQGENQPEAYDSMLADMIRGWRREFTHEDLKFIIVQLPRWGGTGAHLWFHSREKQKAVAAMLPGVTYSVNIDCGDRVDIHPKDKELVGIRAAHAAMEAFYGEKGTLRGPIFKSFVVKGNKLIVEFTHTGKGLELRNEGRGFEICGEEGIFFEAKATIVENRIELTSADVAKPVSVRYAYGGFPEVSLYNKEGYPAEQFRSMPQQ